MARSRWMLVLSFAAMACGSIAKAADQQNRIDRAVERGVQALRQLQHQNGQWGTHGAGSTALAGLALLEGGVKPDNPTILKAAEFIREDVIPTDRVYRIALSIMFLDRAGEPADVPLIQALAVRLMEGQRPSPRAAWNYGTPMPTAEEAERLRNLRRKTPVLETEPGRPKNAESAKLDPDLVRRLENLERYGPQGPGDDPDNSNSQFAVLALWVARRHGVPTDSALRRAEYWYRASHQGGTWTYRNSEEPFGRASTTCAGLLGIAAGAGVARTAKLKTESNTKDAKPKGPHPLEDPLVQSALNFVGLQVAAIANTGVPLNASSERDYYFLWSVERVGMIYGLKKMGTIDWYLVGATIIVSHQLPAGTWQGRYTPEIDTAFALLFLRRSNFAPDLSAALKMHQEAALTAKEAVLDIPVKPPPDAETAARLAQDLVKAKPDQVDPILEGLRTGKGGEFTDALVAVIPQLVGDVQRKARDALAERLARMTSATLRARLRDPNVELRRAAVLACAAKDDRTLIADLIATLDDKEPTVVRAAAVALRTMTGENFGPSNTATPEERTKAIAAWKAWWKKQSP